MRLSRTVVLCGLFAIASVCQAGKQRCYSTGLGASRAQTFVSCGTCSFEGAEPILHYGLIKQAGEVCKFSYVTFARYDPKTQGSNGMQAGVPIDGNIVHAFDKLGVREQSFDVEFDALRDKEAGKCFILDFRINGREIDIKKGNVFLVDFTHKPLKYTQLHLKLPNNPRAARSTADTLLLGQDIRRLFAKDKKVQAFLKGKLPLKTLPQNKDEKVTKK